MSIKAYYYKYFLYNRIEIITLLLLLFLIFGFLLMSYIVYIYFSGESLNNPNLLSSLGIITSAFIASLSVMKTVYQNKKTSDDKFFLEQLTLCHRLAFTQLNKLSIELHNLSNHGFTDFSTGERPELGSMGFGSDIFDKLESSNEFMDLLGILRCYFPHLIDDFINTINKLKQCNKPNEITTIIYNFLNTIEQEQLKYILNKNKIKFK